MLRTANTLNMFKANQPTSLDLDIDKVVSQYTEMALGISQSQHESEVEVDLIQEFNFNLNKLYELNSRVNFLNKEIGYIINKRR